MIAVCYRCGWTIDLGSNIPDNPYCVQCGKQHTLMTEENKFIEGGDHLDVLVEKADRLKHLMEDVKDLYKMVDEYNHVSKPYDWFSRCPEAKKIGNPSCYPF